VFVGEGELPAPDYIFREEALTVGETTVYGAERWQVMSVTAAEGVDAPVVVLRRIRAA
jgi:hypothetical protein